MMLDEPDLFWAVATYLVLGAALLVIVAAAVGLALGFVQAAMEADAQGRR